MIIRKLEETRLNTHQQHFEDLVLFGEEGLDEIDDKIERFKLKLQDKDSGLNTTTKIDGAPAVVCWHKFKGLPDNSICLKSFMTNDPKVISTLEDIESKYNDRPGMSKMLEYCLELSRYIPSGEAWQGDCLFISNTKKEREINGTDYITFQPNKIIYAFSENNPGYEDVKNAEFGIAFHTIYTGDVENKSQNFNVKAENLNVPSKFYILSPALSITNKQEFNLDEINNLQIKFNKEADSLKSDRAYNEIINNKEFIGQNGYWNTFENSNLADKRATTINVNTFIADLKEYINDKLEKEYNKKLLTLKTDKGKEKALLNKNDSIVRLNDLVENNKQTLTNLVNCLNTAASIKMLMWQGFKKNKTPYDTYYQSKSKGYIQADPEGIAMSDSDGNIVKLVDRSTFSSHNRDDDFISGFDHNESLEALDAFKLLEDVEDRKAAVAIFGKFNPPTRAHRKMIQAISDKAKSIGATPIVFASHKVGGDKHPLSYEDKFKYLKAAFGDLAEVKKSEANTPFQVLHELYLDGYTDVVYFSGPDRIGLKSSIPAYNGPKNDKLSASDYYKFNTIDVEILDFEGSPESEIRATKARQAVKDNDFEKFKTLVPFTENVAKQLFDELKGALTEELLTEEPVGAYVPSKNKYIELKPKFEIELSKLGLEAPDEKRSIQDYSNDKDYQGLFVKQNKSGPALAFSRKDLTKLHPDLVDDVDNLTVEDDNGKKFGIHDSGLAIYKGDDIKLNLYGTWATYYQEAIYSLLLLNRIPEINNSNFKEWLYICEDNKGIFKYIKYERPSAFNSPETFKSAWKNFIDSWYTAFVTILNGSNEFINTANKLLNINSAIIIHPYVKGSPAESLELLTGRDSFDKSDVYFCNKEFESEVIRNMLILGNSDIPAYINYMTNNSDKVIGVSLKKPKGSLQITNYYIKEDVTTKEDKYFTGDVVWKTSQSGSDNETQYIRFSTVDGPLELQIRSGGKGRPGVMNFKYPSAAAQKGGAKTVISNLLKNEPELFDKIIKPLDKEIRNFKLSAKNFMSWLLNEENPVPGTTYNLKENELNQITDIFNLSGGAGSKMAPYVFVH